MLKSSPFSTHTDKMLPPAHIPGSGSCILQHAHTASLPVLLSLSGQSKPPAICLSLLTVLNAPLTQPGHQYSSYWHWSMLGIPEWNLAPESAWGRGGQRNCLRDVEFLQESYAQCTLSPHKEYFLLPLTILADPPERGERGVCCKKCELVLFNFKQSITVLQIHNLCMILPMESRGVRIGTIAIASA